MLRIRIRPYQLFFRFFYHRNRLKEDVLSKLLILKANASEIGIFPAFFVIFFWIKKRKKYLFFIICLQYNHISLGSGSVEYRPGSATLILTPLKVNKKPGKKYDSPIRGSGKKHEIWTKYICLKCLSLHAWLWVKNYINTDANDTVGFPDRVGFGRLKPNTKAWDIKK